MATYNKLIEYFNQINEHPKLHAENTIFQGHNAIKIMHKEIPLYLMCTDLACIKDAYKELSKY